MAFNKVILIGNLVADPELKKTSNDVSVTSFRIAVGRKVKQEGQPQADFIDIVAWRQTAEFVTRYFNKGKAILVCGQLQIRSWEDQNGQKRYAAEVVADEVSFAGNKSDYNSDYTSPAEQARQSGAGFTPVASDDPDDELPF